VFWVGLTTWVPAGMGGASALAGQEVSPGVQRHLEAARTIAGNQHVRAFHYLCEVPDPPRGNPAPAAPEGKPDWYAAPARVFDNLYFLGTRSLNSYAVTTSDGIVIFDPLYDYNVDLEIVDGLRTLGLDPDDIRYVIVSHGHGDHYGGARRLQEEYGARVLLSAADWDYMMNSRGDQPKPERDGVIQDGQVLEVGDTSFRFTLTPGHTPGTVSTVFPVRDGTQRHMAALLGGTAMREDLAFYQEYAASVRKFEEVVRSEGADVLLSNHEIFDEAQRKLLALAARGEGDAHPFVIGRQGVLNFLEVAHECAGAGLGRLPTGGE
jgi:metallo-beta-lactamase class B